jgi:fatty-acyl-CoA synthase
VERRPLVVDVLDPEYPGEGERLGEVDYEAFIATGDPDQAWRWPEDDREAIALNYTSGTTGNPRVAAHAGAVVGGPRR